MAFDGQQFGDAVVKAVRDFVARETATLNARITELESRPTVRYAGVWRSGETYTLGSMTTHQGSLWHANSATSTRPGTDGTWTLAVKRGAAT